ncbi:MoxR family ATPase [Methanofollis formosanus]|uniref:MoxR family ATPase n=1 Tax=Methanofollis formosanus TaxID=299308 RepID=A0A8G1EF82_9EURY|nr:MoxR family ATPase [Methanofollis formosanus]QYZ77926.1 MoxR family ATPase [Methanofollis formosanus]
MEPDLVATELDVISETYGKITETIGRFVVGNEPLIEMIYIGMLSEGHILLEGVPGTAKTVIAKTAALLSGCEFSRIQCAVDMQPADIIGVRIYDPERRDFVLRKGPIFSNFVLIDEMNRVSPRTQSAFIEAMSERQATIDGALHRFSSPFFVVATQNPYEFEGTFPLIEAQKDRFMFSARLDYLEAENELEIIRRESTGFLDWETYSTGVSPVLSPTRIERFIHAVRAVRVEEPVLQYIRDIVLATRKHADIWLGASPRASIAMVRGGKALAALHGRTYVIPDDIKQVAHLALPHRLIIRREADLGGVTAHEVTDEILAAVEVQ